MQPLIVASDLHLSAEASPRTLAALADLLRAGAGHEIILAGDVFNLSWEAPGHAPVEAVLALLDALPELKAALRAHLAQGHALTLIAGNHDAGVMAPDLCSALIGKLELSPDAPLAVEPWFVRRGSVHVEHGHFYDPDNAPAHPLAEWSAETEPLGIAITRRFLRPTGIYHFSHAHDTTPLAAIAKAFRAYGARTPELIANWFRVASSLCLETRARSRFDSELAAGEAALEEFARHVELDATALRALLEAGAVPTHRDLRQTFMRLYFDRVFASGGLVLGAAAFLAKRSGVGALFSLISGLYLLQSVQRTGNRYEDLPVERLRAAAERIRELTGASEVILGHTHQVDHVPGYANSGSFGYSARGRPYVRVDETGATELRRV
ncbi:MAG TPA: metallophosphoesterase [Polyangiaceae bacterium]|jgi:UDP-2,3-diacylglucosamine pyrophosphatase LpxH|nr:metallophosphoesterase [Polyangiaceae bacterium]